MLQWTFSSIILLNLMISGAVSLQEDYYWREYTGTVPGDAVLGGNDINGDNVYIGQAYLKDTGLVTIQIYPGVKEVAIPIWGKVTTANRYIKILCGPQEKFYWLPANSKDLHLTLLGKHAVIGGHVDGGGHLNIGRIQHQGETKIGRILAYDVGQAFFYFNNHGQEGGNVQSYEILMYKNDSISIDRRINNVESN